MKILEREIDQLLEQLIKKEPLEEAVKLNEIIKSKCKGEEYRKYELSTTDLPLYFSGNIESDVVFIEFNPGRGELGTVVNGKHIEIKSPKGEIFHKIFDYDSYIEYCRNMPNYKANLAQSLGGKISNFDSKKLHFFTGFGGFNLPLSSKFSFEDMKQLRGKIFQLELVPYLSSRFEFSKFENDFIRESFLRILGLINLKKRKYIFITGKQKQLSSLLEECNFVPVQLEGRKKSDIHFGLGKYKDVSFILLSSYKSQSLHSTQMREYGKQVRNILEK